MGYGLGRAGVECKAAVRTVVLTSADGHFRERLRRELTAMRWQVREAGGGAQAMEQLETEGAEAMVLDCVLPDLEVGEFATQMRSRYPTMDLLRVDEGPDEDGARSPRRNELLHALRQAQMDECGGNAGEKAVWALGSVAVPKVLAAHRTIEVARLVGSRSVLAGLGSDRAETKEGGFGGGRAICSRPQGSKRRGESRWI